MPTEAHESQKQNPEKRRKYKEGGPTNGANKKRKHYDEKPKRATRQDERRQLLVQAKSKWETLRSRAVDKGKASELTNELHALVKGQMHELVFRHDGSRIVQTLLSSGSKEVRKAVLEDLLSTRVISDAGVESTGQTLFSKLVADRYARHVAMKVMRTADASLRARIFEEHVQPHVPTLVRHVHSANVLDVSYSTLLNAAGRAQLVLSILFARERTHWQVVRKALFGDGANVAGGVPGGLYAAGLDALAEEFQEMVLDNGGDVVMALVEKDGLLGTEVVHAVVREWLVVAMERRDADVIRAFASTVASRLVQFAHTRAGLWVAMTCVKVLDAKHRKKVVRSVKSHVRKLALDEFGHRFLICLLEWVDDTRLLGRVIAAEVCTTERVDAVVLDGSGDGDGAEGAADGKEDGGGTEVVHGKSRGGRSRAEKKGRVKDGVEESASGTGDDSIDREFLCMLCTHKYGRLVILNLLVGRDTRYFNPQGFGDVWSKVDEDKFGVTSKKDSEVRRKELRESVEKGVRVMVSEGMAKLLPHVLGGGVIVEACAHERLAPSVVTGLASVLEADADLQVVRDSAACRRTLATVFKVGGASVCMPVLRRCGGVEVLRRLWTMGDCKSVVRNWASGCGDEDGDVKKFVIAEQVHV